MSDTDEQLIDDLICPYCRWRENSGTEGPHFSIDYPEWLGFCEDNEWALGKYTSCECPKCSYIGPLPHFESPATNHEANN